MDKLFPDMPINNGVERVLAVTSSSVSRASQALVSLSFLIVPVTLALAIKTFQLLGPFPALLVIILPLSALLASEANLMERSVLPLPGETITAVKVGKPVRLQEGSVIQHLLVGSGQ
jgi:hypothetical protein